MATRVEAANAGRVRVVATVAPHAAAALAAAAERYGRTRGELVTHLLERVAAGLARPGSWEAEPVETLLVGLMPGPEAA